MYTQDRGAAAAKTVYLTLQRYQDYPSCLQPMIRLAI